MSYKLCEDGVYRYFKPERRTFSEPPDVPEPVWESPNFPTSWRKKQKAAYAASAVAVECLECEWRGRRKPEYAEGTPCPRCGSHVHEYQYYYPRDRRQTHEHQRTRSEDVASLKNYPELLARLDTPLVPRDLGPPSLVSCALAFPYGLQPMLPEEEDPVDLERDFTLYVWLGYERRSRLGRGRWNV